MSALSWVATYWDNFIRLQTYLGTCVSCFTQSPQIIIGCHVAFSFLPQNQLSGFKKLNDLEQGYTNLGKSKSSTQHQYLRLSVCAIPLLSIVSFCDRISVLMTKINGKTWIPKMWVTVSRTYILIAAGKPPISEQGKMPANVTILFLAFMLLSTKIFLLWRGSSQWISRLRIKFYLTFIAVNPI